MFRRSISCLFFVLTLFFCTSCNSRSLIVHGLTGRDANEIVVLLVSKGVAAQKQPQAAASTGGGSSEQLWDISVPAAQITEALAILNQAGLPRMKGTSLLDLFAKQGLVPSEMQEKIRYQEGLSEQMASTIRKMDGIVDASVQISFAADIDDNQPLTASVYIKHRGVLDNPNSIMISKIKRLVASAVPGLTAENVSVISDRASYSDITINGPWGLSDEVDYVSVWGIILAKSSLGKFRLIFYLLILTLFIISCGLLWVIWKTHTLILSLGGVKGFFDPAPYSQTPETKTKKVTEGTEEKKEEQPATGTEETPLATENSSDAEENEDV
ncbi:type III secretion system inner membrane ring lipoprotein SctJ [Chlamydia gallinacea]|uniref:EscJ/YscJ/HrcJ family type III secretion inner membrane ring protein n=2 Tax=Chlamydia gallinacea TaxID=1457153 RepID=A0A173DYI9_9CHLA|nr:type III secretion inner membrane ring lipoprotein SctJ [Chlamydia gallinacea]ANG65999.1 EscJ/YscJ/HrcJ family type III secretion inner membrane ring protein [Chlamydia gallinacea 08-1274/3]AQT77773.1 EscJ/YscJ/HrcJ family type III secretion inner membrane ring protein [Chlamydia gallinacea]MBX6680090.1 type III secretion inner membrane ring lipoprotein SctJ [Chlamydia gallinacea]MBX6687322.1 type III secretion inner membrane ring lipoprotein SctJ [Chlamydia gallinacea]